MSNYCIYCGKKLDKQGGFCPHCGKAKDVTAGEDVKTNVKPINKPKKKKGAIIVCVIVLCLALVCGTLIADFVVLQDRQTYDTDEEIRDTVQGTYIHYVDHKPQYVVIITQNYLVRYRKSYTDSYWVIADNSGLIEWHPKRGAFKTDVKWILLEDGSLELDGQIYQKKPLPYDFTVNFS